MHKYIELCATICEFLGGRVSLPRMWDGSNHYVADLETEICGSVNVGLTARQSKAGGLAYAMLGPCIYIAGVKCRKSFPEVCVGIGVVELIPRVRGILAIPINKFPKIIVRSTSG